MARYQCTTCGYIFDEEELGVSFEQLDCCPACRFPRDRFVLLNDGETSREQGEAEDEEVIREQEMEAEAEYEPEGGETELTHGEEAAHTYNKRTARMDRSCRYMDEIHESAMAGKPLYASMATRVRVPGWDDILIMGASLDRRPLDESEEADTSTVIGPHADKPMVLDGPVYISHVSSISKEAKMALVRGSAAACTAIGSGDDGFISEEREAAFRYICEYVPGLTDLADEDLQSADAVEIKLGEGVKPGIGVYVPADRDDLKNAVSSLRERSGGRPIGVKIAAGHIEEDLEFCVYAEPDFITVDGRGGASASAPLYLRDSAGVPTIYALSRARKYLDSIGSDISLVITGGLRVSSDFAKALAMGADAVAVATGALMAAGCQQYRVCQSGKCPVGIATQDEKLRALFDTDAACVRVTNYLTVSLEELKMFARVTGHKNVHDLCLEDLSTTSRSIAEYTGIAHV